MSNIVHALELGGLGLLLLRLTILQMQTSTLVRRPVRVRLTDWAARRRQD